MLGRFWLRYEHGGVGAVKFTSLPLTEPLSVHLEALFQYEAFKPDHAIERVVPTGHVFLLFELDGMVRHTFDPATLKIQHSHQLAWVSGMHQHHLAISAHPNSSMLVVQFKPGGAAPFLQQAVHQLNDQVIPAVDLFGEEVLDLRQQLMALGDANQQLQRVAQWLLQRLDARWVMPDELRHITQQLQAEAAGQFAAIVAQYPHSQKHLIEQFKKFIGLTPKYLHRIFRFNDILQTIQSRHAIQWSDVACACGFSDQSHFIREFQHFSGFNPAEFLRLDKIADPLNFFPLD